MLGGPQQVKLLAFLLLNANRALSADAVIDAVWGAERDGAAKRLQMGVFRLRKTLAPLDGQGGSRLRTVSGGYLLEVGPDDLDAEVFAELVRDGRRMLELGDPARASELLAEALALWRGPALAEVAFEDFARAEIRRLEELRLAALETRFAAELRLGRHAEADPGARRPSCSAAHPRAPRRSVDDRALLRGPSGRRARRSTSAPARTSRRSSGLSQDRRFGQSRIRSWDQDSALAHSGMASRTVAGEVERDGPGSLEGRSAGLRSVRRSNLPTPATPLVGRTEEVSRALELLAAPEVRLLTLWGPGGSGKTRLALEVATRALNHYRNGVWIGLLAPIPSGS